MIVSPVIKDRKGDRTSAKNYRPIALSSVVSKVFERILLNRCEKYFGSSDSQFGFKAKHGTDQAVFVLKQTVSYYTERQTPVYACFLDLSKAYDRVLPSLLLKKLKDRGVPGHYLRILQEWSVKSASKIKWGQAFSNEFHLKCGVRQGGIMSPAFFNVYMDGLSQKLNGLGVGCSIGGRIINHISYADDMVLLSPSVRGLRALIMACEEYATDHNMVYNPKKCQFVVFGGKQLPTPRFLIGGGLIQRVTSVKYLGVILQEDEKDDEDIRRQLRSMCIRANMLSRKFSRCSSTVKDLLFRSHCQSMYCAHLWLRYNKCTIRSLQVCYNNSYRLLHHLRRDCSASGMFFCARLNSFRSMVKFRIAGFRERLKTSRNEVLQEVGKQSLGRNFKLWSDFLLTLLL